MKFQVRHLFPRPPEVAWREFFSAPYEAALAARSGVQRTLLGEETTGGVQVRRFRVRSEKELPSFAAVVFGEKHLTYDLVERHEAGRFRMSWAVTLPRMGEKVKAKGVYEVRPAEGGCERLVDGEVTVDVPIVGGKIEQAVGDEMKQGYERAQAFARQWLLEHT